MTARGFQVCYQFNDGNCRRRERCCTSTSAGYAVSPISSALPSARLSTGPDAARPGAAAQRSSVSHAALRCRGFHSRYGCLRGYVTSVIYGSVDEAIRLLSDNSQPYLPNTDVANAFRLIPIRPEEALPLLGFSWRGSVYMDLASGHAYGLRQQFENVSRIH